MKAVKKVHRYLTFNLYLMTFVFLIECSADDHPSDFTGSGPYFIQFSISQ